MDLDRVRIFLDRKKASDFFTDVVRGIKTTVLFILQERRENELIFHAVTHCSWNVIIDFAIDMKMIKDTRTNDIVLSTFISTMRSEILIKSPGTRYLVPMMYSFKLASLLIDLYLCASC